MVTYGTWGVSSEEERSMRGGHSLRWGLCRWEQVWGGGRWQYPHADGLPGRCPVGFRAGRVIHSTALRPEVTMLAI